MADYSMSALQRRLQSGAQDSRSDVGIMSRGANIYNGTSHSAGGGRPRTTGMGGGSTSGISGGGRGGSMFGGVVNSPSKREDKPYTFQFNPAYEARMRQLQQQQSQIGSSRELSERRLGEQHAFGMDALQRALDRNLETNEQNMADQGILRSGINIRQQGRLGEEYQRSVSDMSMEMARAREDAERGYAGQEQGIQNQIEMLEYERARQEAEARRAEDFQRAQAEAYQEALKNMQPVANSAGRYYAAGWQAQPNTPYPSNVGHEYGTLDGAVSRRMYG